MEALYTFAIPAVVKFFELVNRKDWKSVGKILLSVATGILAGVLGLAGLDPITGFTAGLSASGLMTIAGYAGVKAGEVKTKQEV